MSVIDTNEPCRTFSELNLKEDFNFDNNIGYIAFFTNDNTIEIKEIIIDKIQIGQYWSGDDLIKSIPHVSFSFFEKNSSLSNCFEEDKRKKISYKAKFYTDDFYSMYLPSNYIDMNDIGKSKIDAVSKLITRDKELNKYKSYFD